VHCLNQIHPALQSSRRQPILKLLSSRRCIKSSWLLLAPCVQHHLHPRQRLLQHISLPLPSGKRTWSALSVSRPMTSDGALAEVHEVARCWRSHHVILWHASGLSLRKHGCVLYRYNLKINAKASRLSASTFFRVVWLSLASPKFMFLEKFYHKFKVGKDCHITWLSTIQVDPCPHRKIQALVPAARPD